MATTRVWLPLIKVGSSVVTAFSLLALLNPLHWLLELLCHFRLQYFALSAALLLLFSLLKNRIFMGISGLGTLINLLFIAPYYLPQPADQGRGEQSIKLYLSNVLYRNTHYAENLQQIAAASPQIVVLQEFTRDWQQQGAALRRAYPHHIELPRGDGFGMAVYSQIAIADSRIHVWGGLQVPSIEVHFSQGAMPFTLLAVHPPPPINGRYFAARNAQLAAAAARIKQLPGATMVVGDLNTSMWSSFYRVLETDAGLRNVRRGRGIMPTWPARAITRIPIDHALVSPHFAVTAVARGRALGSDHLPLIVELRR